MAGLAWGRDTYPGPLFLFRYRYRMAQCNRQELRQQSFSEPRWQRTKCIIRKGTGLQIPTPPILPKAKLEQETGEQESTYKKRIVKTIPPRPWRRCLPSAIRGLVLYRGGAIFL